ncbi:MAG: 50S ribosomal protein L4 [Candidatus Diapherotrites archaeon]|nr:50S ribosomal protein L4 [Candidatus Diapherotrites archaeon]
MKAHIYSVDGKKGREIELPAVFGEEYRPEVIKRAVLSRQSRALQKKGSDVLAGFRTTAEYIGRRSAFRSGINVARARLPRTKPGGGGLGRVARVPHAVGGRRAHPPKVEKVIVKRVNKKEMALAIRSAIAATASKGLIEAHGHATDGVAELPLVLGDALEGLGKTKDAISALEKVGLGKDLARGKKKKVRSGKGTRRGKKYKTRKSVLVVVAKGGRALKNVPGVDVMTVKAINVELLAPGAQAGRLTVYTESAIKELGEKYGN